MSYASRKVIFPSDGIKVQVEGLEGESISQMCRCTGNQSCHGGDWWNDWVWVKHLPGRLHGALIGSLPWQQQQLFKIKLLNVDGVFVEHLLALTLRTIPDNLGKLNTISKFVQVRKPLVVIGLQCFSIGNIVGCTHRFQTIATSSNRGDRWKERGIVTRHMELGTWNDVYNK